MELASALGRALDKRALVAMELGVQKVERRGFHILRNRLGPTGVCPDCAAHIPGVWE